MAISLPHFLTLPYLLQDPHQAAVVPRPLGKSLAQVHVSSMHEIPYKTSPVVVRVLWHERTAQDAPQEWLRGMLERSTEPLRAQTI